MNDDEDGGEQDEVEEGLPADAERAGGAVRVEVAAEQDGLEEHHAGVPDARRPADERQQQFPDQRLDEEQQRGPDEQGDGVQDGKQTRPPRGRAPKRCGTITV